MMLLASASGRMLAFDMQFVIQWGFQIINTAVLFFVMAKILYVPVTRYLQNRTDRIRKNLTDADEALVNAQKTKEFYEEKMKAIEYERNEILELARQRGQDLEKKIIADASDEARIIKDRAMLEIKREQENSLDEMKRQIIEISTVVAEKYITAEISQETQNKVLDEVIADLGDATWLS